MCFGIEVDNFNKAQIKIRSKLIKNKHEDSQNFEYFIFLVTYIKDPFKDLQNKNGFLNWNFSIDIANQLQKLN